MNHAWSTWRQVPSAWNRLSRIALVAVAAVAALPLAWSAQAPQLNDTGQIRCNAPVWGGGEIECAGSGQDGEFGRDVTDGQRADGYAGFSYVKIGPGGERLPKSATAWACVHDRITGLTWEVKTADGGLRDWKRRYTHRGNGSAEDTSGFVQQVNAEGLCGHNDWRLPSRMELQSLVNYGRAAAPMIIENWFPHTDSWIYWTSTVDAADIFFRGHWIVSFQYGVAVGGGSNGNENSVRLVRGTPFPRHQYDPGRFVAEGDKVTDRGTGLVWRRCAEGSTWDGSGCAGKVQRVNWQDALALARAARYDGATWRLPNATELFSLTDDRRFEPAIDTEAFPGIADMFPYSFWSGSPVRPAGGGLTDAFDVEFFAGKLAKMEPGNVRALLLVRVDSP